MRSGLSILSGIALALAGCAAAPSPNGKVELLVLNCGEIRVDDMAPFSRDGRFAGTSYDLVVPCFLIRHPEGYFLWDTGFNQSLADLPGGLNGGGFHSTVRMKLTDQLAQIGLSPEDIAHVAFSHSHPDHAGNVRLFDRATFIVNRDEYDFMFSAPMRETNEAYEYYAPLRGYDKVLFDDEYDVFGDGRAVIRSMPGHTPGSTVLLLRLENAGTLLLTGDLYTHREGRRASAIPAFNVDADLTEKSMEAFEALAQEEDAQVVIQHEPLDIGALPAFPNWLD